jgi:hypothetical protein
MPWIAIGTNCYISGVAHSAGGGPLMVSDADAKILTDMGYATLCPPPAPTEPKPPRRPAPAPPPSPSP